jgi:hypothetical protein
MTIYQGRGVSSCFGDQAFGPQGPILGFGFKLSTRKKRMIDQPCQIFSLTSVEQVLDGPC